MTKMKLRKTTVSCIAAATLMAALADVGMLQAQAAAKTATANVVDRQVQVEDSLVSIFENLTLTIQYGYIQNLNDGRGYTAGRAGFTSGTGDLLEVVQEYTARKPGNALASYLPALRRVNGSASVAGLDGFAQAWAASASDVAMIAAQDAINNQLYRLPARKLAGDLGAVLPMSRAALYEAGIQHGYGDDADSVKSIAQRASEQVGGSPANGIDEKVWLRAFLDKRREDLLSPSNSDTAPEWQDSVGRADAMLTLYSTGNFDLKPPISVTVFGQSFSF